MISARRRPSRPEQFLAMVVNWRTIGLLAAVVVVRNVTMNLGLTDEVQSAIVFSALALIGCVGIVLDQPIASILWLMGSGSFAWLMLKDCIPIRP